MTTEKLYYADAFLKEFTANVLECADWKGKPAVILDRTAFYPEGGGQPADHGTIDGVAVLDVHEKDGVIFHLVGVTTKFRKYKGLFGVTFKVKLLEIDMLAYNIALLFGKPTACSIPYA